MNENLRTSINISLEYIPYGIIGQKSALDE